MTDKDPIVEKPTKHNVKIVSDGAACQFDKDRIDTKGKEIVQFHNKTDNRIVLHFSDTSLFGYESEAIDAQDKEELPVKEGEPGEFQCAVECNAEITNASDSDTESNSTTDSTEETSTESQTELYRSTSISMPTIIIDRR